MNEKKIDVFVIARELAKSNYYQSLFSLAKELKIELFDNNKDFTALQMYFLQYLSFYSSINLDIAIGDVNEIVLDNFIYENAYVYMKNKKPSKDRYKKENISSPSQQPTSQWVFKSGGRGVGK